MRRSARSGEAAPWNLGRQSSHPPRV